MFVAIFCTVVVVFVFFWMAFSYTQKRTNKRYADNKKKAPSIESFRNISRFLFLFSMFVALTSYWLPYSEILKFHDSDIPRMAGALLVLFGFIGLNVAFKRLDNNYSPLFDAYKPYELVDKGVYAYIRHPIYTFNLCVSFGLALSSGIWLVAIAATVGLAFLVRSASLEETFLKAEFPAYAAYCKKTCRFVPYLY